MRTTAFCRGYILAPLRGYDDGTFTATGFRDVT
jgi:hypothetical protein